MYKLRFFAMKGLPKICLKSQCGYRDCFQFSNSALRTGAVKAGKWKEIGSYYIQQVFLALSALETPVDLRRLTLGFRLSNYYSKAAGCSHDSPIPKLSAREKGLRTWKGCKRFVMQQDFLFDRKVQVKLLEKGVYWYFLSAVSVSLIKDVGIPYKPYPLCKSCLLIHWQTEKD